MEKSEEIIERRGPFKVTGRRAIYENPWLRITEDRVIRPDGAPGIFGTVDAPAGVSILPIDDKNNVILIREFMYAQNRFSVEVAGGGIDAGEDELTAAKRELQEELGIIARDWIDLGLIGHSTTIMRASARLYLARGFEGGFLKPEEGIEAISCPVKEAVERVMSGEIYASTSCCLILKAARFLGV